MFIEQHLVDAMQNGNFKNYFPRAFLKILLKCANLIDANGIYE